MHDGLKLTASNNLVIQAFADADWGTSTDDGKSSSGYCLYLGNNLVSCSTTKQKVVFCKLC